MFSCRVCCADPDGIAVEVPVVAVQAERVLPADDREAWPAHQDGGAFDAEGAVFGKMMVPTPTNFWSDASSDDFPRHLEFQYSLPPLAPLNGLTANDTEDERPAAPEEMHPAASAASSAQRLARPPGRVTVAVLRARGDPLGMVLDMTPTDRLRVGKVDATGPIAEYNAGADEHLRVQEGDFIFSVGGTPGGSREKMRALTAVGRVEFEIRRASCFVVRGLVKPSGTTIGLDLSFRQTDRAVFIKSVVPGGPVHEHNLASPESEVMAGDFVVAVNHQAGSAKELVQLIGLSTQLDLTISRPMGR